MSVQLYFRKSSELKRPLMTIPVIAGKPVDVEQIIEWIDLDEYVQSGSDAIYYLRVTGDSMIDLRIYDGDLLVVDRARHPVSGDVVVASVAGEYTVKLFKQQDRNLYLLPANSKYPKRRLQPKDNFSLWGVVTYVIHKVKTTN